MAYRLRCQFDRSIFNWTDLISHDPLYYRIILNPPYHFLNS